MSWNPDKYVVCDFETSGSKPEYALQPWRVAQGKAWATSFVSLKIINEKPVYGGGLLDTEDDPHDFDRTRRMLQDFLLNALEESRTIVGWNIAFDISWFMAYGLEDLALKATYMDGMLLWKHWGIEPEYETNRAHRQSFSLKEFVPQYLPEYGGYEEDIDYHDRSVEARKRLHTYNKQDNLFTYIGTKHFYELLEPQQRKAAKIEACILPLIAYSNLRGLPVDTFTSHDLAGKLVTDAETELDKLQWAGVTEKIVRSPIQLAKLMYDEWKLPVLKENKSKITGNTTRSTDKEVLFELSFIDPRAKMLRQYREALNNKTKFADALIKAAAYNEDDRAHPLAVPFGTYCVTGDVEVMTWDGWVRLDKWQGGDIVQVRPDLTMEFLPATCFVGPTTNEWVRLKQQSFDCLFTPGHTIPYLSQKTFQWRTQKAGELSNEAKYLPTGGRLALNGTYTPDQMRLFAAVQADGYSTEKYLKFTLKKARKITRLTELLTALGIQHRTYVCDAYPDRTEVVVAKSYRPEWCGHDKKVFGPWILNTSPDGLEAFLAETEFWDGSSHPDGGFKFCSSIKENVEWVVTVAALVGRKAAIHATDRHGMTECHISSPHVRAMRAITPRYRSTVSESHRTYCAATQTGFWLARSKGHIFVTGNTGRLTYASTQKGRGPGARPGTEKDVKLQIGFALHQMKGVRTKDDVYFRGQIVAPEGYTLMEFDAAGQEYRWMAIQSNDPTMLQLCLPGEDPHSFMGSRIGHVDYHELMRLKEIDATMKALRKGGKVANLALQFRTYPKRLRATARVDYGMDMELPEAEMIWLTYQRTYRLVPQYWQKSISKVKRLGYAETLGGRRVQVTGDWSGRDSWSMESTSINFPIQGTGACQKCLALACIADYLPSVGAYFGWDLHDGVYVFAPSSKVQQVGRDIKHILDNLPYERAWGFSPPIPLPWDAKAGPSWGTLKEIKFD